MKLVSLAFALVTCWLCAFTLGVWLGVHTAPVLPDCAPYPVNTPALEGQTGTAL